VERQAAAFVATRGHCQACGTPLSTQGHHALTFRMLFGTLRLTSPRRCHCPCTPHETAPWSPLTALLPEHTAPERLFMDTTWAALVSYGLTVQARTDFLPVDETRSVSTVRTTAVAVAQRCEAERGEEPRSCIEGGPRDWGQLPLPDGPMTVGIDGGYGRDWNEKKRQFAIIVGYRILAFTRADEEDVPSRQCCGVVPTVAPKPTRRLVELWPSPGLQMNPQLTLLAAGGDTVRDLPLSLRPAAEPLVEWLHVAMRLTVLQQTAKGVPEKTKDDEEDAPLRDPVVRE
jgi:hypothetical protein